MLNTFYVYQIWLSLGESALLANAMALVNVLPSISAERTLTIIVVMVVMAVVVGRGHLVHSTMETSCLGGVAPVANRNRRRVTH